MDRSAPALVDGDAAAGARLRGRAAATVLGHRRLRGLAWPGRPIRPTASALDLTRRGRIRRAGPAPGLRLHRRRLRHRPPRGRPRPAGELRLPLPAARRGAAQPPRVQADRRERRERLVARAARRGVARRSGRPFTIKKRQISFAWGPQGGGEIRQVAAIEFAVTAGSGGTGTVWIDDLELVPLPAPTGPPPAPVARASSAAPGHEAALAVDGDAATAWAPAADDPAPALELDLGPAARVRRPGPGLGAGTARVRLRGGGLRRRPGLARAADDCRAATAGATTSSCPRPRPATCGCACGGDSRGRRRCCAS